MPKRVSPASDLPRVELYTDGACSGNPGPGGWALILRHPESGKELEQSGGEKETTNNRMELTAVIRGLELLNRASHIDLYTDSVYVGKGLSQWIVNWKANGWKRKVGRRFEPVKNEELWRQLDHLSQQHTLCFHHVRGHSGHRENERCDEMAVEATRKVQVG